MRRVAVALAVSLAIGLLVRAALQSYVVEGHSMEPTLQDSQHVVVDKVSYRFNPPRRGDIVILRSRLEQAPGSSLIKRVFALPGDTVQVWNDEVVLCDPAAGCPSPDDAPAPGGLRVTMGEPKPPIRTVIPTDSYFVMGDNTNNSTDSRTFGPVPRSDIVGRVWLSVWPRSRIGLVADATWSADQPALATPAPALP